MVSLTTALAGSQTYTQHGMNFIDKYRVKKLIKQFDAEIYKAMNVGDNSTKFTLYGKCYGQISNEELVETKETYLMKNVAHKYRLNGFKVDISLSLTNYFQSKFCITIAWIDEIDKLMDKYK